METVEELRSNRPTEVVAARWTAVVAVVLWVPVSRNILVAPTLAICLMFLFVFGAFGVVKGREAGRVMAAVAAVLLSVLFLPFCWTVLVRGGDGYSIGYALLALAAVLLAGGSVWLMYRPRANRYVHLVGVALRRTS